MSARPLAGAPFVVSDCVVVGAGLAGAAVAASLARRGWRVRVLDAAEAAARGASSLPAGALAPHAGGGDGLLAALTRHGVAMTLREVAAVLPGSPHWQASGVLEHRVGKARVAPASSDNAPVPATAAHKQQALLPTDAPAWWHADAGWIRPAALVAAWLAQPGVQFTGGMAVEHVRADRGVWSVCDRSGTVLAQCALVVLAAAMGSNALAPAPLGLRPVRGQVSWALHRPGLALPDFVVNGGGHFLPAVPLAAGTAWLCGSSYGQGDADGATRPEDEAANRARLHSLLPALARQLQPDFDNGTVHNWAGVRCASTDRRPLVGELAPGLWTSTAMGSRGLTFACLCAELLAARLHGEPLPLAPALAAALDVRRLQALSGLPA